MLFAFVLHKPIIFSWEVRKPIMSNTVQQRGREIRFIKGKYIGYNGWINDHGDHTAHSYAVIVSGYKSVNGGTHDRITKVRKESVRDRILPPANSKSEAIMQQHPEIEQTMEKLCRQLAKCDINPRSNSIKEVFGRKLLEAVAKQIALGNKATWKRVDYTRSAGTHSGGTDMSS
jgi:hypothetical protein